MISPPQPGSDRLPVLTYHMLTGDDPALSTPLERFRRHLDLLQERGFRGLSLGEAQTHLERNGCFPERAVVLTFDDGYRDLHSLGLRELADRDFSATVFLLPGLMDKDRLARGSAPGIGASLMDWHRAAECLDAGLEMGAHGLDHPDFTRLGSEALERQLAESRQRIADRLGCPVEAVAYPYGRNDARVRQAAGRHFRLACTTHLGRWHASADPLAIHRIDAYYLHSESRLKALLEGRLEFWLRVRQALRDIKRQLRPDEPPGYPYG